ncbi:hypothetical protein [Moraxella nasicaprae]|uniref:Uncharacterized protein n=1 Tax=Moraxella nasicaprae TaxID=2904122 RepID=A0ABY6F4I2_9GAMM|nr:hypothetical protein [Moraxella nasicaprae]UXZ04958.1 hypothetical protein LU297_00435 [Moraxella nasicaprae]
MKHAALWLPILLSLLIHAVLAVLLFVPFSSSYDSQPTMATLINPDEFAAAKARLNAHHQPNQTTPQTQTRQNPDRAWQASDYQPVKYSQSQIASTPSNVTPTDFGQTHESSYTPPVMDEMSQMDNQMTQSQLGQAKNQTKQTASDGESLNLDNLGQTQPAATPKVDIAQAQAAINARIESIWASHPNQPNQAIKLSVSLDDGGQVIGISVRAGHQDLLPAAEATIRAAAPFSELAGVKNSFVINLVTTQEIAQ